MPLVNFLEKKEAYFLDKQKQGIIYIGGEPHPPNHSKLMDLDHSFCSRLIKSHTHSCQIGTHIVCERWKDQGFRYINLHHSAEARSPWDSKNETVIKAMLQS